MLARFYRVRDIDVQEITPEKLVKLIREYVRSKGKTLLDNIVICVDQAKLQELYRVMKPGKA